MNINLSNSPRVSIDFGVKVIDVARAISVIHFRVDDNMNLIVDGLNANEELDLDFKVDESGNLIVSKK